MTTSKVIYYDLETTGVEPHLHGIHQIAGIVEVDNKIVADFDIRLKPHPKAQIDDDALAVGGITRSIMDTYMPMNEGYLELRKILFRHVDPYNRTDKFHLAGYNNRQFDDRFLRRFFEYNGDNYFGSWFWADSIDIMVLASNHLLKVRSTMPNFKLISVCQQMGIEFDEEKAHDGFYDIKKTRTLHKILDLG